MHGKLFLSIVQRDYGERIVAITKHAGARGGTIALGRGTAESSLLEFLGIGDTEQDVVFTIATDEQIYSIMEALRSYEDQGRRIHGIVMRIDISDIIRHILPDERISTESIPSQIWRVPMNTQADHVLITLIVNRGYADDAMIAARKAGATGGTILNARGTGKEEDVKFFGILLVPEKEILLILVDTAKARAVLDAVKVLPCLSEPGGGIAYSVDVEEFITLGKTLE